MLPRGEQRALLLLGLLVFLSLGFRIGMGILPKGNPPGLEQFQEEALMVRAMLEGLERPDNLERPDSRKPLNSGYPLFASGSPVFASGSSSGGGDVDSVSSRAYSSPRFARSGPRGVHLNTADSVSLLSLPGIGPVFAGRIVKYRRLLGGFYSPDQLREVYGMKEETIEQITPFLLMDSLEQVKLHVNTFSFRDLLRHPYLEYEDVKALVSYIDLEGAIDSMGELRDNNLLPEAILDRIEPYLDFSH